MIITIKKGSNYGRPFLFAPHLGVNSRKWMIKLYSNCYYEDKNSYINKIVGWTTDILGMNSLRVGWKPINRRLYALYAYVRKDGSRYITIPISKRLGVYEYDKWVMVSINSDNGSVTYISNEVNSLKKGILTFDFGKPSGPGYFSNVYFSKDSGAPHDMTIEILYE